MRGNNMDKNSLMIPYNIAKVIIEMADICYNEGIGPKDNNYIILMKTIAEYYPELKQKYSYLDWPII